MVAKQKIEYNPLFSKEMAATIRKNTKECDTSCRAIKSTLLSLYPNEQETIEKVWRKGKRKIISFALRKMESEGDNVNIELIQVLANARSFMKNINDSMYHSLLDIKISSLNLPKMTLSNEPEKVVGKNKAIISLVYIYSMVIHKLTHIF